ncbi:(2Fe-2S)-binding protein [Peptoniphilus catoniae]|uniref:(2Fe-2S)-binding protein n=1 Tax=Peptoniphilus catoniae TaxID=1660341 RepID=UPI0010FF4356|nr:(2Fe-2S)-binding protein [Peptoniphilus catoniae]
MITNFTVNNSPISIDVPADRRLIDILREDLNLTGTKESCAEGECGACSVIMDGKAVHSCLTLAAELEGKNIITIEGLEKDGELDSLQKNFVEEGAIQCGYCSPGMIISAKALLMENPKPTREEIKVSIAGNICRCSGYQQIIKAIEKTAADL